MEEIQFNLFLNNLRDEEKRLYRKYEKTYFRIITTTKAIVFTENNYFEILGRNNIDGKYY